MASGGDWKLYIKDLVGGTTAVTVNNPQTTTVQRLKELIHQQKPSIPPYKQKLVHNRVELDDSKQLSHYSGLGDQSVVNLVVRSLWMLYVQTADKKMHEVEVPSVKPEEYFIADFRTVVEKQASISLDQHQFFLGQKPLPDLHQGKKATLGDHGVKHLDTLLVVHVGLAFNITNPKVDLCFMVDCTGSMGSWIETVKNNITTVRDQLEKEYKGCDLHFAFVRYTDYDVSADTRTTWIDFTTSAPAFRNFVGAITAGGGGDGPEDIMGGLKITLTRLSWRGDTAKVLIHIADYPCHGKHYHDSDLGDTYPNGDPAGISHEEMMSKVASNHIQYWFGYINKSTTDKMISVFNDSLRRVSHQQLLIRQFEAIKPKEVSDAVHKSLTASVGGHKLKRL